MTDKQNNILAAVALCFCAAVLGIVVANPNPPAPKAPAHAPR